MQLCVQKMAKHICFVLQCEYIIIAEFSYISGPFLSKTAPQVKCMQLQVKNVCFGCEYNFENGHALFYLKHYLEDINMINGSISSDDCAISKDLNHKICRIPSFTIWRVRNSEATV